MANCGKKRLNIAHGSVRAGKTFITILAFLQQLRASPPGENFLVSGCTEASTVRNVIEPMDLFLGGLINYREGRGRFKLWDQNVFVCGAPDDRAVKKNSRFHF